MKIVTCRKALRREWVPKRGSARKKGFFSFWFLGYQQRTDAKRVLAGNDRSGGTKEWISSEHLPWLTFSGLAVTCAPSIRRPLLFRLIASIRTILFQTLNRLHCLPITPMCATTRHTDSVCSPLTSQAMVKGKQLRALMFQFPNSLAKINWRYRVNLKSANAVGVTVILRRVPLSETGEC